MGVEKGALWVEGDSRGKMGFAFWEAKEPDF